MHRQIAGRLTGRVTKWLVLVAWLVAAGGLGTLNAKLADVQNNEASSWLPGSAESTQVIDALASQMDPNQIPTLVVYEADDGTLTASEKQAIGEQAQQMAGLDGVIDAGVVPPEIAAKAGMGGYSDDGAVAVTLVTFDFGANGWNDMPDAAKGLRDIAQIDGVTVHLAGAGGQAADSAEAFEGIDTTLVLITLGVVILILLLTYRSPMLWILPIVSAVVALSCAGGIVYLLAKYADVTVNGQSQSILSILVIGAGTDYALLLTARYREELRKHEDRHEAMAVALHRAAPAILASAGTVVLGMLCLLLAELNSTAGLGPVNAVGVAVTFLVMVTLLPALLVICGRWVFWPKRPAFGSREPNESGLWAKVGALVQPHPRRVWILTSGLLALACLGLFTLNTAGLSTEDTFTHETDSVKGQKVLLEHGLLDTSNTLQVVAAADDIDEVAAAVAGQPGVGTPSAARPIGGGRSFFEAPIAGDVASAATQDVVKQARVVAHRVDDATLVGGWPAVYYDTKVASDRDTEVIIPVVLSLVMLVLVVLLRSVLAPVLLIGTVVLSFGAALGISALLFEYVFGFAGSDPGFPLFAFVFLVALGIDYNIFLMTRVREEAAQIGTRAGALVALRSTGGVITSAGLVLAATFLTLASIPFVFLVELGVAVALGVLLDTFIVRSVLVTALALDLGDRIWWPGRASTPPAPAANDAGEPAGTMPA
ncbi:MMPL family transporter [Nocardioides acrostichi]|uniref:MMPL family transporter n=1 Tax=Nocardioides acrostichi TaxID=2784339 RepID=A0A930Y5U3_9ACTN|nr:MMPL family transporter [Nocardioides acrostichi]MBF4161615.1 MMPL family transporter [Nocardioides acrostichi]